MDIDCSMLRDICFKSHKKIEISNFRAQHILHGELLADGVDNLLLCGTYGDLYILSV